eukprot:3940923-Rhodomonas_salina.2
MLWHHVSGEQNGRLRRLRDLACGNQPDWGQTLTAPQRLFLDFSHAVYRDLSSAERSSVSRRLEALERARHSTDRLTRCSDAGSAIPCSVARGCKSAA